MERTVAAAALGAQPSEGAPSIDPENRRGVNLHSTRNTTQHHTGHALEHAIIAMMQSLKHSLIQEQLGKRCEPQDNVVNLGSCQQVVPAACRQRL